MPKMAGTSSANRIVNGCYGIKSKSNGKRMVKKANRKDDDDDDDKNKEKK